MNVTTETTDSTGRSIITVTRRGLVDLGTCRKLVHQVEEDNRGMEVLLVGRDQSKVPLRTVELRLVPHGTNQRLDNSLDNSQDNTLDKSLDNSLVNSLDNTLDNSLVNSLDNTLGNSLDNSLDNTLENSQDNTLDNSLDNTLDNTLDNSQDNSQDNSLDNSLDNNQISSPVLDGTVHLVLAPSRINPSEAGTISPKLVLRAPVLVNLARAAVKALAALDP